MTQPVTAESLNGELRSLSIILAERLRSGRSEIISNWLDRISARVAITPNRIFPTEELLNHVPLLIDGLAHWLEHPEDELDAGAPVLAKAMELGALRHAQGFDAYEILKEHEILGAIVVTHLARVVEHEDLPGSKLDLVTCLQRVWQAIELMRQATVTHFLRLWSDRVQEREERLRRFNRMVTHELKNRVGAIRGASSMLAEEWIQAPERERFEVMIRENAVGLQRVLDNLMALSRIEDDTRQRRNVLLPQAIAEAVRQLRTPAQLRGVDIRVADDMPTVEVDAAAVELCLVNYISNGIKYSDPSVADRWVEITGEFRFGAESDGGSTLVVRVRDNGVGVPESAREQLFERFYRAHDETVTGVEGTGLGLSLVRETMESLGGKAWAEFPDGKGTIFAFSLPSRREDDAASAGTRRLDSNS